MTGWRDSWRREALLGWRKERVRHERRTSCSQCRKPGRQTPRDAAAHALTAEGRIHLKGQEENCMQKITPFLWFDGKAEEAMNFYVSIFKNSKIMRVSRSGPEGKVTGCTFKLDGHDFLSLNIAPQSPSTPALSLLINRDPQPP